MIGGLSLLESIQYNSVVERIYKDYGRLVVKLNEVMDSKGISVDRMSKLTGIQYQTVKKYYEKKTTQIDQKILAKFCFVLKCDISDILCYHPPIE